MRLKDKLVHLEKLIELALRNFPDIYHMALSAVKQRSVKKYIFEPSKRTLWVVIGKDGEYIVREWLKNSKIKHACSCPDFLFHVMLKTRKEKPIRKRSFCYHIIAKAIAELNELRKNLGENYDEKLLPELIIENDEYYMEYFHEITEDMRSLEIDEVTLDEIGSS